MIRRLRALFTPQPRDARRAPAMSVHAGATTMVMLFLCAVVTLMCLPAQAFAQQVADGGGGLYVTCGTSKGEGTAVVYDYSACLPAGRWAGSIGSISSRSEPADGLVGGLSNMVSFMGRTMRLVMPNILLAFSQMCWNVGLSLNQFASTFNPLQKFGAQIDIASGNLANGFISGNLPAVLVTVGLFALIGSLAFNVGKTRAVVKRLLVSIVCFAALIVMGAAATGTQEGATAPNKYSPWWVVQSVNDTVNQLSNGINMFGDNSNGMGMAHKNKTHPGCPDYLDAMHEHYRTEAQGNRSAAVEAISTMWEETALRSWVTMQWGSPAASDTTDEKVAANARMAYCHVLEMNTNTNTSIQRYLTNKAMGLDANGGGINQNTANYLFSTHGWLSPQEPDVTKEGKSKIEGVDSVRATRAAVFWETCTSPNKDGTVASRPGWRMLVNNLNDEESGEIKNVDKVVRAAKNGKEVNAVFDENKESSALKDIFRNDMPEGHDENSAKAPIDAICTVVLGNQLFQDGNAESKDKQAAALGYLFDVPNVGATWNEANLEDSAQAGTHAYSVRTTLDYFYGNKEVDTLGAFGSLIGAFVSMLVYGFAAIVLIISKAMLVAMCVFLIAAVCVQMVPVGDAPARALKNWSKTMLNICLVGLLYSLFMQFVVFICRMQMSMVSSMPNSFISNLVIGLSPATALACIAMFFTLVLHTSNPFNPKTMMGLAGGGVLAAGAINAVNHAKASVRRRMKRASKQRYKAKHQGGGKSVAATKGGANPDAASSEAIMDKAAKEQDAKPVERDAHGMRVFGDGRTFGQMYADHRSRPKVKKPPLMERGRKLMGEKLHAMMPSDKTMEGRMAAARAAHANIAQRQAVEALKAHDIKRAFQKAGAATFMRGAQVVNMGKAVITDKEYRRKAAKSAVKAAAVGAATIAGVPYAVPMAMGAYAGYKGARSLVQGARSGSTQFGQSLGNSVNHLRREFHEDADAMAERLVTDTNGMRYVDKPSGSSMTSPGPGEDAQPPRVVDVNATHVEDTPMSPQGPAPEPVAPTSTATGRDVTVKHPRREASAPNRVQPQVIQRPTFRDEPALPNNE